MRDHSPVTIKDIYWLAGLLEGEGYFGIKDSPIIVLKMNDKDIVSRASRIMKPGTTIYELEHENINHNTSYSINIVGNIAIQWMFTLHTLMGSRRKAKIKHILEVWKARPLQPKITNKCRKGHPLEVYGQDYTVEGSSSGSIIRRCIICKRQAQNKWRRSA